MASLANRAREICRDDGALNEEMKRMETDLQKNDYPLSFIRNTCKRLSLTNESSSEESRIRKKTNRAPVPYFSGISEALGRRKHANTHCARLNEYDTDSACKRERPAASQKVPGRCLRKFLRRLFVNLHRRNEGLHETPKRTPE